MIFTHKSLNPRIQLLIIILVVFSFIFSGFLLIGFYKNIFKRLTAITNIADSIRLNEPLPKINIDLSDEITNIAKTLYRLDHDITKKEHIIKNRERSLEDKSSRLSKLNNQLINVIESERQDIAQFIHNDIGQHLTAIKFELDWLTNNNLTKSNIVSCQQLVNDCMLQIKKVSRAIHTPFIKELGLKKAFLQLLDQHKQYPIKISYEINFNLEVFSHDIKITLYRAIQESLNNIIQHANATNVLIQFNEDQDFVISIADDGVGMPSSLVKSTGLTSIEMRLESIGGGFLIENNSPHGLKLTLIIPKGG